MITLKFNPVNYFNCIYSSIAFFSYDFPIEIKNKLNERYFENSFELFWIKNNFIIFDFNRMNKFIEEI